MDNGLLPCRGTCSSLRHLGVLILIVMDNGLLRHGEVYLGFAVARLNPYCNG